MQACKKGGAKAGQTETSPQKERDQSATPTRQGAPSPIHHDALDDAAAKSPYGEEVCPDATAVVTEGEREPSLREASPKVLPRLGRQRAASVKSPRASKADLIKQQLTALKKPQARNAVAERKGTPQKPPPIDRRAAGVTSPSPSKAPLPLKYSQLLETFSK